VQPIDRNLSLLERMIEELEPFLLSKQVFWPLNHSGTLKTSLPRLTLGGLLLTLSELAALNPQMDSKQVMRYDRLLQKFEGIRQKWRTAIENKAIQELKMRLNLWRGYLNDVEEQPNWIENYPTEVRNRVMIDHLTTLIGPNPELENEFQAIGNLDHRIQDFLIPGEFIWEDSLRPSYPQEKFPYLYMKPRDVFTR
jgi:hypothetical protein